MDSNIHSVANHDLLIWGGELRALDRSDGDVTGLPADATLILEADWTLMCEAAGGSAELIEALRVEDMRNGEG